MKAANTVAIRVLIIALSAWSHAQETISKDDVVVVHFQELKYPPSARSVEGVVVVRAKLDKLGRVVQAEAISGNAALISDSLANVKTWQFEPKSSQTAVVVYNYRMARGVCKSESSFFVLERPNLANITACWPASAPATSTPLSGQAPEGSLSDQDIEVLDFEDLRYPPLAEVASIRGIVVIEAKLDENGRVLEASAIFGHQMLARDCVSNVKKWRFRPNPQRRAVVVYYFRFPCEAAPEDQSQFLLNPPNFVTITGTRMSVQSAE